MKISIAWIFDHIAADWKTVDVAALVARFNQVTAEIEGFQKIVLPLDQLSLVQIKEVGTDAVTVYSAEWQQEYTLRSRHDAQQGSFFMVRRHDSGVDWACAQDFFCAKDSLLPAFNCSQTALDGSWKKSIEAFDYILEVDNKSITHRPDMWGHRGFAQEVSALLNLSMKPIAQFLVDHQIEQCAYSADRSANQTFALAVQDPAVCKRFAGLYIENVRNQPSLLWTALRLLRVDSKPIDAIVDATNYVMLDLGNPMHAFDAAKLPTKTVIARFAKNKEALTLLDGQTIELTSQDFVITDGQQPIALAGIMGGKETGVNNVTTALFVEAAHFDPGTIRLSAQRFKKRSEASARFEKNLDPNGNTRALLRFCALLEQQQIAHTLVGPIASLGAPAQQHTITITHSFIQRRLGITLTTDFVVQVLAKLDFTVTYKQSADEYTVMVPTARSTKDVLIKEDLVEEVGRFFGYGAIQPVVPYKPAALTNVHPITRVRTIKKVMATALAMREVYNYSFFDEEFLNFFPWKPSNTLAVQNPVSANWRQLVTTLVPNLFKNVQQAATEHPRLRFFEWARTWQQGRPDLEKRSLAGVVFAQDKSVDFYQEKESLNALFAMLDLAPTWIKAENLTQPWYNPYQTAHLVHGGVIIGTAGNVDPAFMNHVTHGEAFIFELDGDFLLNYAPTLTKLVALAKYPEVVRDVSLLVPLNITVHDFETVIKQADQKIVAVELIDLFEKADWVNQKSVTFRFVIRDNEKTLTKQESDQITQGVIERLQAMGAIIR